MYIPYTVLKHVRPQLLRSLDDDDIQFRTAASAFSLASPLSVFPRLLSREEKHAYPPRRERERIHALRAMPSQPQLTLSYSWPALDYTEVC